MLLSWLGSETHHFRALQPDIAVRVYCRGSVYMDRGILHSILLAFIYEQMALHNQFCNYFALYTG